MYSGIAGFIVGIFAGAMILGLFAGSKISNLEADLQRAEQQIKMYQQDFLKSKKRNKKNNDKAS